MRKISRPTPAGVVASVVTTILIPIIFGMWLWEKYHQFREKDHQSVYRQ